MNKVRNIVQLVLSKVSLYYHCCYEGLSSLALLHPANPQKTLGKKICLYSSAFAQVLCCAVMRFGWLIVFGLNCLCLLWDAVLSQLPLYPLILLHS